MVTSQDQDRFIVATATETIFESESFYSALRRWMIVEGDIYRVIAGQRYRVSNPLRGMACESIPTP